MGQGTQESSITNSVNISGGVKDLFEHSEHEIFYGEIKRLPQSFMDDLGRFCLDPVSAQMGNDRF